MDIQLVDVTLHVDETLDTTGRQDLENALRERDGVVSVHVENNRPHLFLIEYNPDRVAPIELLGIAQANGVHGELIGL